MRKVLAILLCVAILLPCVCVGVSAEENHTFYKINIDSGSGTIGEKAIVEDGEIYISADSFSNYTRFSFDKENKTFLIKGQELKKAFKSVVIDIDKKRMLVSGKKFFNLSNCFEIEGELYLPLCQMLPILNADVYEVKDNIVYISNNKLSLAEVLYDFDISDYYFNISTEFYDMDWAALLTIVPNYVWDTVVNVRFDRLDIIYSSGEYNDYKDALSDFLSDDNLYLKAMAENASAIDSTVEFFNKANSTAKDMKSVYGWVESAGKSEISSETGGVLLDSLKAYYDSGDLKTDDLKGLNDAWTGGKISFGDCIEILTYAYTYATQVEDNRQMLNAVYNVDSKISKKETARKAAKQVYDLYGDNILPALYKEVTTTVASDALEDLSPIGIYTATAKVAGTVLETFMPFEPREIAKLPVYSDVVLSALSKYRSYDTLTDDSTENLRLSLLICMIASKKCFEVMGDVFGEDTSYYKNKIEKIEQLIMGLYIAEENTEFDSFEHFEKYKKVNLKKIAASKLLNHLEEYQLTEAEALKIAKKLISQYETYNNMGVACDLKVDDNLSSAESKAIWEMLPDDIQGAYDGYPEKSMCCKTYEEAKMHVYECIDSSLVTHISEAYVSYNDELFFFMGNKGGVTYQNVCLKKYNNERIIASADFYGSGDNYCGTYKFTITKEMHYKISNITEELRSISFDNTYWNLTFGQTMGTQYAARFHSDGTILAFCSGSGQFSNGAYKYTNGKLTVTLESYKNIEFNQIAEEFQSVQKYKMQVGENYYKISQTDGSYFLQQYKKAQQEEKLKSVKKVFPDCYKSTEKLKTNGNIKTGRYEGFGVGVDNGYSYITLREDQTFSIETNVDHNNHKIISPVSFEGKYVVYKRTVTYPDDSTGYSTALILYFEDYVLAWYEAEDDYFGDQSSGYDYIG